MVIFVFPTFKEIVIQLVIMAEFVEMKNVFVPMDIQEQRALKVD